MNKHVKFKDVLVAKGSELHEALEAKDNTKAERIYKETSNAFRKFWPKEFDHLLNYRAGDHL